MNQNLKNNQRGVVSIMVTMIMILVISLIVMGFAQVARRNQREALDRQLSTQAYYAAETGVNDATTAILKNTIPNLYTDTSYNTDCNAFINQLGTANLDSTRVQYTCLLVNPMPTSLTGQLNLGGQLVWPLVNSSGTAIKTLTFTWSQDSTASAAKKAAACPALGLPTATNWPCSYALLRADLVKADASSLNPTDLTGNAATGTVFMAPSISTVAQPFTYGGQGDLVKCTAGSCKLTINMPGDSSSYYLRLTTQYQNTDSVSVTGADIGGGTVTFQGAQAIIDSTGRAQDELRRLQVRVPLTSAALLPENALQSTASICKYFSTAPGYASADYSADTSASCKYQ